MCPPPPAPTHTAWWVETGGKGRRGRRRASTSASADTHHRVGALRHLSAIGPRAGSVQPPGRTDARLHPAQSVAQEKGSVVPSPALPYRRTPRASSLSTDVASANTSWTSPSWGEWNSFPLPPSQQLPWSVVAPPPPPLPPPPPPIRIGCPQCLGTPVLHPLLLQQATLLG